MINYYKKVVFENYFNFKGRATRSEYWYFTLMNLIIAVILQVLDSAIGIKVFGVIYSLLVLIPGLSVAVRRLHDIGKSGWVLLVLYMLFGISFGVLAVGLVATFIPAMSSFAGGSSLWAIGVAGVIALTTSVYLLVLFCKKSDEGTNKYGSNPFEEENELDLLGAE